ncbi:DNA polymerase epsilon subunit B [Exophiala dermatitidis]|uniref:DNA polymerase epsilon subunit B n=1 Tax=Exophiala dermatitidis (strain ATCC 34100 / CBS 525.76 / NIH/UT8656) TaxID=858893 RepID=H6CB82_EXODN|nr:DNA polymerase epsilon subunit 2 [Exophiala dermatitidis NIH/UT8656]EHY61029.1 DNA polymerase epsilon subunit 2 [Exophiala dermatitidis NIH/UT8656]
MEDPMSTPRMQPPPFNGKSAISKEQLLSSSPGFGTPAYPIVSRPPELKQPLSGNSSTTVDNVPTVLPILLPPQALRRIAFKVLNKTHDLDLRTSGLNLLATFIGKYCGSGWRSESLAERVLDEVGKLWKRNGGGHFVEDGPDKKLANILKLLEPCMSGGRIDPAKLSRANSATNTPDISRTTSFKDRPGASRDDSQTSLGVSGLQIGRNGDQDEDEHEAETQADPRSYLKVISAFEQPRMLYSTSKKCFEPMAGPPSLLPPIQHKISMFRNRYHVVHQRLLRNESFQAPTFSTITRPPSLMHSGSSVATLQQAYKLTPISNLLGRSGTSHLLLGMLVHSAAGDLALSDLSGSVVLDMSIARPIPENGAWFCPGMIVLVEGTYEEDGSHNSSLGSATGVGGQIKGHFIADTMAGPPAERRAMTIGSASEQNDSHTNVGAGYGWIDFLGVGSEKGIGSQMRKIQKRIFGSPAPSASGSETSFQDTGGTDQEQQEQQPSRTKIAILGECNLDSPRTLEAIRAILSSYTSASSDIVDLPLSIVLMGNFVSAASMAGSTKGGGSVEYKEHFDALASMLAEFPTLLSTTTLIFVPGDNDPWASSFSAGAACPLPRQGIPEVFTSRVRRAIATANAEHHGKKDKKDSSPPGEAVWTSNPARISLFGPLEEIVLFRDDITSRFRRNAVSFSKLDEDEDEDDVMMTVTEEQDNMTQTDSNGAESQEDTAAPGDNDNANNFPDSAVHEATSHIPSTRSNSSSNNNNSYTLHAARKLIKTVLDQSHLAPFPPSIRPVFWDHATSSLSLYPLPTALVLADAETPGFAITYEGCHVMNPGRVVDELALSRATTARGAGVARWVEYDVQTARGEMRDVRF